MTANSTWFLCFAIAHDHTKTTLSCLQVSEALGILREEAMSFNIKYSVSLLLCISFVLLSVLVPGGPIETRSFANIDPLILGAFNTFLTSLAIVSILLVYFVLKNMKWAYVVSIVCGVSYFLVYALDLGGIFPISPDSMPQVLFIIEILGTIASIPLVYYSIQGTLKSANINHGAPIKGSIYSKRFVFIVLILVVVGIGIIVFATKSAMAN